MRTRDLPAVLREGVIDPGTTALLWLLIEGRVPLVLAGPADATEQAAVGRALLSLDPSTDWTMVEAKDGALTTERLTALLRGGPAFGVTFPAVNLEEVLSGLEASGLPADGVRRLGVVMILDVAEAGLRCTSAHYLRPTERDAQGHLQRRPPAVLTAWDSVLDVHEDYAWGITPELADRVDRSQADLEERRAERAGFLTQLSSTDETGGLTERVRSYLASEPARTRAPEHPAVRPSPFHGGLLDPDSKHH